MMFTTNASQLPRQRILQYLLLHFIGSHDSIGESP